MSNENRRFFCSEEWKTYTYAEVLENYCECLKADPQTYADMTFEDYLRNATDKNGSLEEVNLISADKAELIRGSANNFLYALHTLAHALDGVDDASFNEYLSNHYPFEESFDEAIWTVLRWVEDLNENADKLWVSAR